MFARIRNRMNPNHLYMAIETAVSFSVSLVYTTAIVYWVKSGRLNPLQLILLGTMVEISYFISQLPTGVMADMVSRRLSVIIGMFLTAIGFGIQGSSSNFVILLIAQIPVGIGAALMFGAQEAWLADEAGNNDLTSIFLRSTQLGLIGSVVGSILSGVIALSGLNVPFLVAGSLFGILGIGLICFMPEHNFRPPARNIQFNGVMKQSWRTLREQTGAAQRAMVVVPGLVLILGMIFFMGLWGESFDRLWGAYLLKDVSFPIKFGLHPVMWFSFIAAIVSLLSLGSTEIARRRTKKLGPSSVVGTLLGFTILTSLAVVAMTLAHSFTFAVIAYLVVGTIRPVFSPLLNGWMIKRIESEVRATALSAVDMFGGGGQILGGPLIGVVGVIVSIRVALQFGATALVPAAIFLIAASRRIKAHPEWGLVSDDEDVGHMNLETHIEGELF